MVRRATTRAAIYLRISLDAQGDGLAVERQREDCERIVEQRGWAVSETYIDQSKSAYAKSVHRPDYERMVKDFHEGRFDALVVWDLDRLTRQPRQLEDWIDAAEDQGLLILTANGEADLSSDGGRMFARVKAAVARSESERKAVRQRRAARQRAELGKCPKGVRLTGYKANGEIEPAEASTIQQIYARFLAGDSLSGIATWLDQRRIPTRRGGRWTSSSVRSILTNPRYAGLSTYSPNPKPGEARVRTVVGPGTWTSLVSADDFALAQARLEDPRRATNRAGTARKHLGSGIYLCDECGSKVKSWSGDRYACKGCGLVRSMALIDEAVAIVVRERLMDPRIMTALNPPRDQEVAVLREEAQALRSRRERIAADYDQGLIDGTRYRVATQKVETDLDRNLSRQLSLSESSAVGQVISSPDPASAFANGTLFLRRALIDALVEVRIRRAPRGSRAWHSDSVVIQPKSLKRPA